MAKFELKFKDSESKTTIECNVFNHKEIEIITRYGNFSKTVIYLDKSTAIKFAKTLRTEINKITEQEAKDGNR
jgi:hypothetical protein